MRLLALLAVFQALIESSGAVSAPGASSYVAPAGFPTSAFTSYYFLPASPTQEPQPAIYDPVLGKTYPSNLTNPDTIPGNDPDPIYYPKPTITVAAASQAIVISQAIANVSSIILSGNSTSNCTKCINALVVGQA